MKSKWYELKPAVLALRRNGKSLSFIEQHLGVPRSTISGWCSDIELTDSQHRELRSSRLAALAGARAAAAQRRNADKQRRIKKSEGETLHTLASLDMSPELLKLGLAMLYWSSGDKTQATAMGSSDPVKVRFFLKVLEEGYRMQPSEVSCELRLRKSQEAEAEITYWSKCLGVPRANFRRVYFAGQTQNPRRKNYHGICRVYCPSIDIQRELVYLYKSFSDRVISKRGD